MLAPGWRGRYPLSNSARIRRTWVLVAVGLGISHPPIDPGDHRLDAPQEVLRRSGIDRGGVVTQVGRPGVEKREFKDDRVRYGDGSETQLVLEPLEIVRLRPAE